MKHDWHDMGSPDSPNTSDRLANLLDDSNGIRKMICANCGETLITDDTTWADRKTSSCRGTTFGIGNSPSDQKFIYVVKHAEHVQVALSLKVRLEKSHQMRIKIGMDPTAPDLTIGHMVPLRLVRKFQDWGHKAVVIVGDITARVGDPTGVNATRPLLTKEQIGQNVKTYIAQLSKILLMDEGKLEIRFNSEWLAKLDMYKIIELTSRHSVRQMLQRETFRDRFENHGDIRMHEMLYPLLQGYDSHAVNADVEIGGTDQLFNMQMGRQIQQDMSSGSQIVITTPLLVGLDGVQKMSKSKGNFISLNDSPEDVFGKVMSIKDSMMPEYFRLLTDVYDDELLKTAAESLMQSNPMAAKMQLARMITASVHSENEALVAEEDFNLRIREGKTPIVMPEVVLSSGTYAVSELMIKAKMVSSRTVANRKIKEGAVRIDGTKVSQQTTVQLTEAGTVIQLGKRHFVRLKVARDDLSVTGDQS